MTIFYLGFQALQWKRRVRATMRQKDPYKDRTPSSAPKDPPTAESKSPLKFPFSRSVSSRTTIDGIAMLRLNRGQGSDVKAPFLMGKSGVKRRATEYPVNPTTGRPMRGTNPVEEFRHFQDRLEVWKNNQEIQRKPQCIN